MKVVVAVGVARRRGEGLHFLRRWTGGMLDGVFLAVLFQNFLLHGLAESGDGVTGFSGQRGARDCDRALATIDFHEALGAGEEETFRLLAAVDEVDMEGKVEALGVVEQV